MSLLGFKRVLNGLTAGCVDAAIGQECLLDFFSGNRQSFAALLCINLDSQADSGRYLQGGQDGSGGHVGHRQDLPSCLS